MAQNREPLRSTDNVMGTQQRSLAAAAAGNSSAQKDLNAKVINRLFKPFHPFPFHLHSFIFQPFSILEFIFGSSFHPFSFPFIFFSSAQKDLNAKVVNRLFQPLHPFPFHLHSFIFHLYSYPSFVFISFSFTFISFSSFSFPLISYFSFSCACSKGNPI